MSGDSYIPFKDRAWYSEPDDCYDDVDEADEPSMQCNACLRVVPLDDMRNPHTDWFICVDCLAREQASRATRFMQGGVAGVILAGCFFLPLLFGGH